MEKRIITLPAGGTLEVDCTSEFLDVVKKSLNITGREVSDADLRNFIYEAFKTGIDNAERDINKKEKLVKDN
tara:strand:- start:38 stop:253 length:216 start_codon:yes stop_codon:yes gene_type:complete